MLGALLLSAGLAAPPQNVALLRPVEGRGLSGTPEAVTRGRILADGVPGTPDRAAILADERSVLVIPLGEARTIRALILQCEADDEYLVERSVDGRIWTGLLQVRPARHGSGLQMQAVDFADAPPALFLAVHARGGDGHYAVSQVQAFETLPQPWPPQLVPNAPPLAQRAPPPRAVLTEERLVVVKGVLALAGTGLLLWGALLSLRGRPEAHRRLRDALLLALGALGVLAFFNFGRFHGGGYAHLWDSYHYYAGAKYFPELGYTRLYACSVAADLQAGRIESEPLLVTDLTTNELKPLDPRAALADCRPRFTDERWRAFVSDVTWFRERERSRWYEQILRDHGYNATPAWAILGRAIAETGAMGDGQIGVLTKLDLLLLAAMWLAVLWAFGWRGAAVAALFWGTNYPARFLWNGGAYLRMDWLACAVLGVCFLRKARPRAAGAFLAMAALLRIFPGVLLLGLAAVAVGRWLRERKVALTEEERGLLLGAAATAAVVLPLSLVAAGWPGPPRWRVWSEFAENSKKHLATPLTNNMGLKTLLAYRVSERGARMVDPKADDPWSAWKQARRAAERRTAPFAAAAALGALVLFAAGYRARPAWVVAAGAIALLPFFTQLTCYYYSVFLLLGLLAVVRPLAGVPLLAFSTLTALVPQLLPRDDDAFAVISLLALAAGTLSAWLAFRPPRRPGCQEARAPEPAAGPRAWRAAGIAVSLLALAYAATVAPETIRQHRALQTRAYDLGIMENVLWNTAHGRPFESALEGGSHLGVHTSFIYLLLVPVYALLPRAETLLVLQTLLLSAAAWPLFLVARHLGFRPWQCAALSFVWLAHPAIAGANFYDFHELAFGPVLFFSAFLFLLRGRDVPLSIAIGLLLLVKEDMAILVAALGVFCLLTRRRRVGVALLAAGVAAYVLLQHVVIPRFAGRSHSFAREHLAGGFRRVDFLLRRQERVVSSLSRS